MSIINQKYIGSGITFPIELNTSGRVDIKTGVDLINSAIKNIFAYPRSFRFYHEEFGCRIHEVLDEPDDNVSEALAIHFIRESLRDWEKRIDLKSIKVLDNQHAFMNVEVIYSVSQQRPDEVLIFPFYKEIPY